MALLDEVDLLLHPLKSELNVPIGDNVSLDLQLAPDRDSEGRSYPRGWPGSAHRTLESRLAVRGPKQGPTPAPLYHK